MNGRRVAGFVSRAAVAIVLVALLVDRADLGALDGDLITRPEMLVLAIVLVPFSIGIRALNLSLLVDRTSRVLGLWRAYRLTLLGVGAALFLPVGAADLVKAHFAVRYHGQPEQLVTATVLDKLTALTAVAAMGLFGALAVGNPVMAWAAGAVLAASLVPYVAPSLLPWRWLVRVIGRAGTIDEERLRTALRPGVLRLSLVIGVSVVGWIMTYLCTYLCALALGAAVDAVSLFAIAPFTALARLVPVSLGGVGLGEVTMSALLVGLGVAESDAVRTALLSMVLLVLAPGLVGIADWTYRRSANASDALGAGDEPRE